MVSHFQYDNKSVMRSHVWDRIHYGCDNTRLLSRKVYSRSFSSNVCPSPYLTNAQPLNYHGNIE